MNEDLEKLLALRPTNAAARLGQSPLPLLNPRDLVRAFSEAPGALWCVPVAATELVPGLLRAARDSDALIGLSCVHPQPKRDGPTRFFEAVRSAADEIGHRRPFFLQAGPIKLTAADDRSVQVVTGDVFRFVDAGFSSVSFDATALSVDQAAKVLREVTHPALERELSIEIAAPARADRKTLATLLEKLAGARVRPNFVRLRASQFVPEQSDALDATGDFEALAVLRNVVSAHDAWVSIDDRATPLRLLSSWTAAEVRKVDLGEPFARRIVAALPPDTRAQVEAGEGTLSERIGRRDDPLRGVSPGVRDRIEAVAYGEALEILAALGAQRSARRAQRFLLEGAGY